MEHTQSGRALRPADAAAKLGIGVSTLWLRVKSDPSFPRPFKLSERTTVFYERELDAFLAARAAQREAA
jgi:prophage regulatory protein